MIDDAAVPNEPRLPQLIELPPKSEPRLGAEVMEKPPPIAAEPSVPVCLAPVTAARVALVAVRIC